jgi:dTDP-4-dehydrorhamnose reductase
LVETTKQKRILVTGASGMLGKDVVAELSGNSSYRIYGLSRGGSTVTKDVIEHIAGDLTKLEGLAALVNEIDPSVIIHCAANTDVDNCEANRQYTHDLHVGATSILAAYKPETVKFYYISTDSVFDGEKGGYTEQDQPRPLNYYALSKYQGEQAALEKNNGAVVLRTNIYGYHIPFKRSLVEWAIQNWDRHTVINGFCDIYFNPLYTRQLARVIIRLLENRVTGVINIGCAQTISKYDFLALVAKEFGYDAHLLMSTTSDAIPSAKRPKNTTLDVTTMRRTVGDIPDLVAGIKELRTDLISGGTFHGKG